MAEQAAEVSGRRLGSVLGEVSPEGHDAALAGKGLLDGKRLDGGEAGLGEPPGDLDGGGQAGLAIPASLVLAFLGINGSQVNAGVSMFSGRYLPLYLAVGAVIVVGVLLSAVLWAQQRRESRHYWAGTQRPRWTLAPAGRRRRAGS